MKKLLVLFGILYFNTVSAQTAAYKAPYINDLTNNSFNGKVEIRFSATKKIDNLLVLVADSAGHTIFLDNRINFKGNYKRILDLKKNGKGKYCLKVNDDDEQISKILIIE